MSQPFLVPPALQRGDAVRVVAPSGPFDKPLLYRALGWLSGHYELRYSPGIFAREGYLAGADQRRLEELQQALSEPEVKAVMCARGGYGLSRIAHRIDWSILRRQPRWLVGFSDITALHVEAMSQGVASLHAANLTGLGRGDAVLRESVTDILSRPEQPRIWSDLQVLRPGVGEGVLFGGNLTLLHACAAAGRLRVPPRCVLLIEEVSEQPYRLDRMITTLRAGGHLVGVVAVVLGELLDCRPGKDGVTAEQAAGECFADLAIPIVAGAPVGHGRANQPFVVGGQARVLAEPPAGTVRLWAPGAEGVGASDQ